MKDLLLAGAIGLCSLPAFAADPQIPTDEAPPAYTDVQDIIANNCQFCHTGGPDLGTAGISLDTEAEVVANAKLIYAAVSSGLMPYGDDTWHLSEDGQTLIAYAKAQIPVNPANSTTSR